MSDDVYVWLGEMAHNMSYYEHERRRFAESAATIAQLQERIGELEIENEGRKERIVSLLIFLENAEAGEDAANERIAQLQARVEAQQRDIKQITADFSAELKEMRARTIEECANFVFEQLADAQRPDRMGVAQRMADAIRARLALTGVGLSPNPDIRQRPDE